MDTVLQMLTESATRFKDMPYVCQKGDDGWEKKTFSQVEKESATLAKAIIGRGYPAKSNMAILSEGRANWIISEFAILKSGITAVPLGTKLSPEEIPFRINHSESRAIFTSENNLDKILSVKDQFEHKMLYITLSNDTNKIPKICKKYKVTLGKEVVYYEDLLKEGETANEKTEKELQKRLAGIQEDDVVTISYTSGTTGNPKGIMLTHKNYFVNSHDATEVVNIPTGKSTLIVLPLDHSFAHTVGLYVALLRGISMHFVDARGGGMAALRNIPGNLVEVNPYFLLTVPALTGNFMKKIVSGVAAKGKFLNGIFTRGVVAGTKIAGDGFKKTSFTTRFRYGFSYWLAKTLIFPKVTKIFGNDLHFCVGGGALLELSQQEFYNAIGIPVYQGYGLTEATPIICANSEARHKFGTSGNVFPSITYRIMKDDVSEQDPGVAGELAIRGGNVMKGYYKNKEATAEALRDGELWTGDLAYMDEDNFMVVTGRAKALLISADGEKYSPESIEEEILNNCPLVNQVMIYNDQRKYTTGFVTLNTDKVEALIKQKKIDNVDTLVKELKGAIYSFKASTQIPSQWIPSTLTILEEAFSEENKLINSTLKLVRHKVTDYYADKIEAMYVPGGSKFASKENKAVLKKLFKL